MIIACTGLFLTSFILSLLLTRLGIYLSFKWGILDVPLTLARKNHSRSTPLLGGSAVFFSFYLSVFLIWGAAFFLKESGFLGGYPLWEQLFTGSETQFQRFYMIFIGAFLIYLVGLKDDMHGVGPAPKLLLMFLISLLLYYLKVRITLFIPFPALNFILTLLWMVALSNSFNLLDNMDGLSSGVALGCSINLLYYAIRMDQYFITFYLVVLIGALSGFLRYNYWGGRIFMGDSGALFVGFSLAVVTILESFFIPGKSSSAAVLTPLFVFSIPFYDTLSVILIRIKNGQPIYKGDLNHLSHRIHRSGYSKRMTVLIIFFMTLLTGVLPCLFAGMLKGGWGWVLLKWVLVMGGIFLTERLTPFFVPRLTRLQ